MTNSGLNRGLNSEGRILEDLPGNCATSCCTITVGAERPASGHLIRFGQPMFDPAAIMQRGVTQWLVLAVSGLRDSFDRIFSL